MKKILLCPSSIRLEWVLGFLALACGSSVESSAGPDTFAPPAPAAPAPEAPIATPATPAATPTNVDTMEGAPSDVPLDGSQVGGGPAAVECTDVAPDNLFTCAEQVGFGKCGEAWMQDRCNASCGRCVLPSAGPSALDPDPTEPSPFDPGVGGVQPVTPNASREARNLLGFLYKEYGVHMISGQMESTWTRGGADAEIDYVEQVTGKVPALRGLDFIQYDGVAQRTIEWWERGGIADIRWHWGAPTHGEGYDASQEAVDIDAVLTPGTPEYQSMMDSLDRTAEELTIIRDANVPVLWTPFHELNGNWFWWGKEGPDQFIRLWRFMFDYYTQEKGLNNLIWVLGYTGNPDGDWYPGKEYVDIAGADSYGRGDDPRLTMFNGVKNIVGNAMPVAYHENGIIPSAALARQQGANWSWFMTWHTSWITTNNTQAHIQEVYADDFVLTLDEMPNLR